MTYPDMPDGELVLAAALDPDAFACLYDRYLPQVFAFVASRLPCRMEAEDVTSDIWMKILGNISRFKPKRDESVPAWIFAIARNAIIDAHRKRRPYADIETEDVVEIAGEDERPGASVDRRIQFVALQAGIDTLPDHQARCIRLRYYGGLRNQEIAQVEGLNEKTVAAHISRGLQALRDHASSSSSFPLLA